MFIAKEGDKKFECLTAASVATFEALVLRIHISEILEERDTQMEALMESLHLTLLHPGCIHVFLEAYFSRREHREGAAAEPGVCGSQCWNCRGDFVLYPKVGREAATQALHIGFSDPKVSKFSGMTGMELVSFLFVHKKEIWLPGVEVCKKHAHRLVLQLVAAGILSVTVVEPSPKERSSATKRRVILRWAIIPRSLLGAAASGGRDESLPKMAFTELSRWVGISSES